MLNEYKFEQIKYYSGKNYYVIYIFHILIYCFFMVYLSLSLPPSIENLKNRVYSNEVDIFLPGLSTIIIMIPLIFLIIVILGLIVFNLPFILNKNYYNYVQYNDLKQMFKNKDLTFISYFDYKRKYFFLTLFLYLITIISLVFFIFSFDFYYKINSKYFIVNDYFSVFKEEKINLNDIKEVFIYTKMEKSKSGWELNPYFEMKFENKSFEIWVGGGWGAPKTYDLIRIINLLLNETKVTIKYSKIPENQVHIIDNYGLERSTAMREVFNLLNKRNERVYEVKF